MNINIDKSISKPFLSTENHLIKKWYICFRYKNYAGEQKEYKRTFDLNKPPYVIKGNVNDKTNIVKERLNRAKQYVNLTQKK